MSSRWLIIACGVVTPARQTILLQGATIQLLNMDSPYNVAAQPRPNNALAAGLSSFGRHASR